VIVALLAGLLAAGPAVQVGLERVEVEQGGPLRGKRVGLVVHGASVTADGRHAIEVLRKAGVDVRRLFTPEHGLRGRVAAGEKVASGLDAETGLPVVSLYGEKTKPAASDLEGIDALVYDLQDAGVRFYTYSSTMILCLEAAAESGIELVVLDRPNPLGGARVEGPHSDPRDILPRSLVNTTPGPLVHGLTLGEMARLVNAGLPKPARLTVVPMRGWKRAMLWEDTGRAWPTPSPNLRSAAAALAYPGTCLLEATNASEGRGSEAPFLLLGAPWLRPEAVARAAAGSGFALEVERFTPRPSEAAPKPRFADLEIPGLRVRVTDRGAARPYALGVALLRALRSLHPDFAWRDGTGAALDRLVGTRRLREALARGETVEAILAADAPGIAAFTASRKPFLLYD
jgi:uncharacterized protein YbbC (DUF1343 family)